MPSNSPSLNADRRWSPSRLRFERSEKGAGLVWLLTGGAFVTGMFIARLVDWRGHAHPRV